MLSPTSSLQPCFSVHRGLQSHILTSRYITKASNQDCISLLLEAYQGTREYKGDHMLTPGHWYRQMGLQTLRCAITLPQPPLMLFSHYKEPNPRSPSPRVHGCNQAVCSCSQPGSLIEAELIMLAPVSWILCGRVANQKHI